MFVQLKPNLSKWKLPHIPGFSIALLSIALSGCLVDDSENDTNTPEPNKISSKNYDCDVQTSNYEYECSVISNINALDIDFDCNSETSQYQDVCQLIQLMNSEAIDLNCEAEQQSEYFEHCVTIKAIIDTGDEEEVTCDPMGQNCEFITDQNNPVDTLGNTTEEVTTLNENCPELQLPSNIACPEPIPETILTNLCPGPNGTPIVCSSLQPIVEPIVEPIITDSTAFWPICIDENDIISHECN